MTASCHTSDCDRQRQYGVFEISQGGKSQATEEELACTLACKG
jgi:hypothetical protein